MTRHLGRIATAALFMTAYCQAITWDGSFEFDSPGDYDPLTDTCYTQAGHPALPAEGTSGTANLVLPPDSAPEDGYLRIVTTGGRRAYRLVDAPGFSHNAGWTVEYRIRFDRSHDYRGTETAGSCRSATTSDGIIPPWAHRMARTSRVSTPRSATLRYRVGPPRPAAH